MTRRTAFALGVLTGAVGLYVTDHVLFRLRAIYIDDFADRWIMDMAKDLPPDQVKFFN